VIYVTGGASGMGLIAGQMLAGLGAHIGVFDLNPTDSALHAIESARRWQDQRVTRYKLNVADREMVLAAIAKAVAEFGAPDIAINTAGIGIDHEFISEAACKPLFAKTERRRIVRLTD
jgi:NAD(P)-dependent dehydrogenase (short-subunit alcohol dehydrogenase family)